MLRTFLLQRHLSAAGLKTVYLVAFLLFFSAYDLTILSKAVLRDEAVTLSSIINNQDARIDEGLMYLPWAQKAAHYGLGVGDSYLLEHRDEPNLVPRVPVFISAMISQIAPTTNWTVFLLHTLLPALSSLLLLVLFRELVGGASSVALFALVLMSVSELMYQPFLELAELGFLRFEVLFSAPWWTHPSDHNNFSRFFSPGLTAWAFIVAVGWMFRASMLSKRDNFIIGLLLGLQLYVYPHHLAHLSWLYLCLWIVRMRDQEAGLFSGIWTAGGALLASAPFVVQYFRFRSLPHAIDVLARIGHDDSIAPRSGLFILMLIGSGILLGVKLGSRGAPLPRSTKNASIILISCLLTLGTLALACKWVSLPQTWLVPTRMLTYFSPIFLLGPLWDYGAAQWRWPIIAPALFALCVAQEVRAGWTDYPLFHVPREVTLLEEQISGLPGPIVIQTETLRAAGWLAGETQHFPYVGYGINSTASNQELLERLMISAIVTGTSFDDFNARYFLGIETEYSTPGSHWVYHHGQGSLKPDAATLQRQYESLSALSSETILSRYRLDYIARRAIAPRFEHCLDRMTDALFRVREACHASAR